MKLYYPITVDLYQPYPLPIMEAQQNNIGRGALVTLTAQGAVITPTGESIQLYAKKPDGTISYLACTLTGSQIECDFTNQMLALPGMVQVELQMIGGESGAETEITTPIFCVRVNPSNVDDSAVESQDEFPALVTALAELAELKENGLKGDPGEAATIQIGTVTASDPGSNPQVTNSGTEQDAVLNFVLPRGEQGPQGETGPAVSSASDVLYSNASSGLTADNVQAAIDENAEAISGLNSSMVVQTPGNSIVIETMSIGLGISNNRIYIAVQYPFLINGDYDIAINELGITNVIGGESGAESASVVKQSNSGCQLAYDGEDVVFNQSYFCSQVKLTITFKGHNTSI